MKKFFNSVIILLNVLSFVAVAYCNNKRVKIEIEKTNDKEYKLNLSFNVNKNESIYSNSIIISTNDPYLQLSNWQGSNPFLTSTKELNENFNILISAIKNDKSSPSRIIVSYLVKNKNESDDEIFDIDLSSDKSREVKLDSKQTEEKTSNEIKTMQEANYNNANNKSQSNNNFIISSLNKFSSWTQDLIKKSTSIWLQLFLVFILGILMSFTPCIYPVIPITAGILQMQGSKSIFYNFFISLSYAFGMAITFAILGLTAALSGNLFGQLLMQPIFVLAISTFLIYLAFSMFGFYDMYIPKFLNTSSKIKHKGSPISAFFFGAISGSIASPCLSPGLALLLTIVAALANKFIGFLLLFSFGIGLSIPLIIIGTFSSSIGILPKAGMWMVEVKKIFGFLLLGVSFYYLNNILPFYIILWLIAISLCMAGIWYLHSIESYDSKSLRIYKNVLGVGLIVLAIPASAKAYYKTIYRNQEVSIDDNWHKNYNDALQEALSLNKNLLIDIGAPSCTLCKAIDKNVFNDSEIKKILENFVLVKMDASNSKTEPYASIKKQYKVIGIPTILIINPKTKDLLKRFEGELYDMPKPQIIQHFEQAS